MTLEQVKAINREYLIPREVADVLGCDPQWVRVAAREYPELLGFPVCVIGTRTKIPKVPFLKFIGVDD